MSTPLLFLLLLLPSSDSSLSKGDECTARCERLHERSIQRIRFDPERVQSLLEKQRPASTLKDVCWRLYDKLDCLKRCPKDKEIEKYARDVRFKCKNVLGDLAGALKCVSRYRSFIQVKCSTFLKEAVSQRVTQEGDSVPDRETCRYLHLNSLCLENTVGGYCPAATNIFRRLNFRDYFLNFIIPQDDHLFDDVDLDSCQIFDFVKGVKGTSSQEEDDELTTIVNRWEEEEERATTRSGMPTTVATTMTTRAREKQKFTILLNELLSAETSTEISIPLKEENTMDRVTAAGDVYATEEEGGVTQTVGATGADRTLQEIEPTKSSWPDSTTAEFRTSPSYTKKTVLSEEDSLPTTKDPSSWSTATNRVTPNTDNSAKEDADTSTLIIIPSNRRKVFSDDSMENIPPNFFYSSARYRTSTLSANHGNNYASEADRDKEIVRPVEVDTSTLLGDDFSLGGPVETEAAPWTTAPPEATIPSPKTIFVKYTPMTTTPRTTSRISVRLSAPDKEKEAIRKSSKKQQMHSMSGESPLLNGGVIVKSIKRWGEPESDEEVREVEKIQRSPTVDEEDLDKIMGKSGEQYEYVEEVTTQDARSRSRLSENEILIFIYLVLCALALVSLICVLLFCIFCRRRSSPDIIKY